MAGGGTWTTPKDWTSAVLSSADMDTYVSGNDNALTQATSTITTTGTQTALAIPTGHGDLVIIANNASLLTLQGIAAGQAGQRLTVTSVGAGQVDLANQNASATAANRIANGVTGTISLAAGVGRVDLVYDDNASRWRVVMHEQGATITPTFDAGDFTATTGNWTVDSADVVTHAYYLRGRVLAVWFDILNTDVSATPAALNIEIPGGFTSKTGPEWWSYVMGEDAGTFVSTRARVQSAATVIALSKTSGSWSTTSSDNTRVFGWIAFEVQ